MFYQTTNHNCASGRDVSDYSQQRTDSSGNTKMGTIFLRIFFPSFNNSFSKGADLLEIVDPWGNGGDAWIYSYININVHMYAVQLLRQLNP